MKMTEIPRGTTVSYTHLDVYKRQEVDCYCSMDKQYKMLQLIFWFEDQARPLIDDGVSIDKMTSLPVRERIGRAKFIPEKEFAAAYETIRSEVSAQLKDLKGRA